MHRVDLRHWTTRTVLSSRCSHRHAQRKFLNPKSRNYQLPSFSAITARPNTLSAKLWYRKDGTPRSKWKGVAYASVFALACWGYSSFIFLVQELDDQNTALSAFIRFQQSEDKILSADLSSLDGSFSCMQEIISGGYDIIPRAVFDRYFDSVLRVVKSEQCPEETRQKVYKATCNICERVRSGLQESKSRDKAVVDIAVDVMDLVTAQFLELQEQLESVGSEEEMDKIMDYLNKSKNEKRDGNYEEIGE